MNLKIATERILLLQDQISFAQAEEKATINKLDAFGTINKLSGFFNKPQDSDFELVYSEHRLEPFWYISSHASYVYDRSNHYQYDLKGDEVKTVTVEGKDHVIANGHLHLPVLEHCSKELKEEVWIDGISGAKRSSLQEYTKKQFKIVETDKLNKEAGEKTVIVPPQTRVSGIIREMLSQMIQGIEADTIFKEDIEIAAIDLYYRPVYSFQFLWKSKDKKAILDVDAVTGETKTGTRTFNEFAGKTIDRDFLFDIGADLAGIFIPGGSIAVKTAKKIIDTR